MTGAHQREHVRIETDALLDYAGQDVLLFHRIQDLSLGGLSILTPTPEPKGTKVVMAINFPDLGDAIEIEGEVAWVKNQEPKEMGIRFTNIAPTHRKVLNTYIKKRTPLTSP
jgi:uncharacterized protein (TIGR02266 family)